MYVFKKGSLLVKALQTPHPPKNVQNSNTYYIGTISLLLNIIGWIQLSRPITHGPQVAEVLLNLPDLYRLCYYPPLYGSTAQ